MKIAVIGNCQARPLANLLQSVDGIECLEPIILHLARPEERAEHCARLDQADVVVAQWNAPQFPVPHLRVAELQAARPDSLVIWPNVFFIGQTPYLRYATHAQKGRICSPLTEYHDLWTLRDWFRARRGVDFAAEIETPDFAPALAAASLDTLVRRERECTVGVGDLIAEHWQSRPLFFTFNHPRHWLLARLAERILDRIGRTARIETDGLREPLSRIQPPGARPGDAGDLQGVEVDLSVPGRVGYGQVQGYAPEDLRAASFACYDHQADLLDPPAMRLTP
ncbi:MAG: WcbI family polysaccharide biosynthesis putative acetyltransferase [Rhodobacter sp.]|nr:WcbI family polysaccharide biosynthesis putative acetyltransferase [Rhodobacter sp.]